MNYLAIAVALLSVASILSKGASLTRSRSSDQRRTMSGFDLFRKPFRCPRLPLPNGRARYKNDGREMRFKCLSNFRLLGDQYAICVRGRWHVQPPVCVRSGCSMGPDPMSGSWQLSMGGAVATLVCDPGYTLVSSISSQIYCDGHFWRPRRVAPACRAVTASPKTSCDFESEDICGWSQDSATDFLWIRNNYSTPSGNLKTGPSFDHTYGFGFGGHYMFIETSSPRKENDVARLYSPVYAKELADDGCFMFWFHMFGTTVGSLKVYVKLQSRPFKDLTPLFQKSGNQGPRWIQGIVSLTSINETFQVVIQATSGNGFLGDIAIDDVALRKGDDCFIIPDQPITAAIRQDVETASRGPLVKFFPTFLPAPPLPDLPPMPPGPEAVTTHASQTPSAEPTPPSPRPLPIGPLTGTHAVTATSSSILNAANSTSTSVSVTRYEPHQPPSIPHTTNRSQSASSTLNVSTLSTVITTSSPTGNTTVRNKALSSTFNVGTKYRPSFFTTNSHLNAAQSVSFIGTISPIVKLTSARLLTTAVPSVAVSKRLPTVRTTRPIVASGNVTTLRRATVTSVKATTPKQPLTAATDKKNLVTNGRINSILPSKTSTTPYKVPTVPAVLKTVTTTTTIRYRFPPSVTSKISTTTILPPFLPLTTTRSTKATAWTSQRVVKPVRSSNRIQAKAVAPRGSSTKTIVAVVAVVITALLCSVAAFFFVKKRLRLRRQRNVAEDSDVRYLTSDEILDFNMARPADEDT